ncbi:MAG: protoporphyrinogen oxidase, partial [Rothia dentocariosa]|nr:protoporphyrinogen oxidase [Rothia dentocariosa]
MGLHRAAHPHIGKNAPTAIVVGGGVSGLLAARELAAAGVRVTLLEQKDHLGGAVGAHEVGGLLLDSGAESYATRSPIVSELVKELGLGEHIVTPNPHGSWLYLPFGARKTPNTGIMGIPGNLDDKTLLGVLGRAGLRRAKLDKALPASVGAKAKTLGELVRARMGNKVLKNLVAPVVSGVYSAHPDQLDADATIPGLREGLKKHKSLAAASAALRAQAPAGSQVASLSGGLNQLSEKLVEDLYTKCARIIAGFDVIAIDRDSVTGEWFVIQRHTADGEIQATLRADYLVLATDGPTTARLLGSHIKTSLPTLEPGPEVALVTLVVEQPALNAHPRGTGMLVSEEVTNVRAKALTHVSAKWPWVAEAVGKDKH